MAIVRRLRRTKARMSRQVRLRLLVAAGGILASLGLFVGSALSLDGGPSPTPTSWTILLFLPFVISNPVYLLILPLSELELFHELIVFGLVIVLDLCWWFVSGVAVGRRSC